jgi:hypothetical protein
MIRIELPAHLIRIELPAHLLTLPQVGGEVKIDVENEAIQRSVLDELEAYHGKRCHTLVDFGAPYDFFPTAQAQG